MDNHEEETGLLASADIQVAKGNLYYQRPAIVITERNGDLEVTHEFLTFEDYKQFKMLEDK